ncbi:heterokaryon incompatibility protein-domain-containing protein [Cercophora newfieldiana]|uniref:Heterokaryon incompatibility protein-domain-containing protein n=1 Tax=Cercophora newfieldiana TaxID=92897 RepID=A0AA39Y8H9_9PEZI|nr:heterokaryon incompatibility protein-domain-containing protein [Cercophora newfieldiana]
MRLIDTKTLALSEFFGDAIPEYAILSHTWGSEEVTLQDWDDLDLASKKAGYAKIQGACHRARMERIKWLWVDTNCIDKSSSAELTEAINSMFDWYMRAEVCYAHLSDVPNKDTVDAATMDLKIQESRWFSRGWTLQELLAPKQLVFYASDWSKIGNRSASMSKKVSRITGIGKKYLRGDHAEVRRAPIARKMSWLAPRTTTRVEDMAYCMMGLFDINMPLLYGEGAKAFTRLQHEIIKASNDHTIFCWAWTPDVPDDWTSLLAPSAAQFRQTDVRAVLDEDLDYEISIYSMTNAGLSIHLPVVHLAHSSYILLLQVRPFGVSRRYQVKLGILVHGTRRRNGMLHVFRQRYPPKPVLLNAQSTAHLQVESVLVTNRRRDDEGKALTPFERTMSTQPESKYHGAMIAFDSADLQREWETGEMSFQCGGDKITALIQLDSSTSTPKYRVNAALLSWMLPSSGSTAIPEASPLNNLPDDSCATIFIFVALRESISSGNIYGFCQMFINLKTRDDGNGKNWDTFRPEFLDQLKEETLGAKWKQPVFYLPDLNMTVMLDVSNNDFSRARGITFLRFSKGLREFVRKIPKSPQPSVGFDLDDDSGDSAVAIIDPAETLHVGKTHSSIKGGFSASGLEDGYLRWKEKFIKEREDMDGWSDRLSRRRPDSGPDIGGLHIGR